MPALPPFNLDHYSHQGPMARTVADRALLEEWVEVMMTLPFNIASRCPVLSVPSGLASTGVPIGLSVVGRTYDDVTVFHVAAALCERAQWFTAAGLRPTL